MALHDALETLTLRDTRNVGLAALFEYVGDGDFLPEFECGNIVDPGSLEAGQTYLWRVDALGPDGEVTEGALWSFTVEPPTDGT